LLNLFPRPFEQGRLYQQNESHALRSEALESRRLAMNPGNPVMKIVSSEKDIIKTSLSQPAIVAINFTSV